LNETEALRRAAGGDRAAFGWLVQAHQGYLRQWLRRLCHGDLGLADDVAQEAFLAAWRALPGFRGEAAFRSWLTRLAYRCWLRQRGEAPVDAEAPADEATPDPALQLDLQRALDRLRPVEREAVLMCCHAELSHAEAAAALGLPLGTLKTHVLRGRARLRELLGGTP
jgi:RNA polymerase sigma-70 factor (ECF subfamily)